MSFRAKILCAAALSLIVPGVLLATAAFGDEMTTVPKVARPGMYVSEEIKGIKQRDIAVQTSFSKTGKIDSVQVAIISSHDNPQKINYRFLWLREDSSVIPEAGELWQTSVIKLDGLTSINGYAPRHKAVAYRLDILPANQSR